MYLSWRELAGAPGTEPKGELTSISYVNSQESGTSAGLEVLFNLTGTINFSALLQRYVPSSYKVRLYKTVF